MVLIEFRHLKTLVALRDSGSLVEAAETLFLTQSALSHQLKDLEDRLGCRLFVRKTKPPRFTSAGRRLLNLADEILPMVKNAERNIARSTDGENGRLHIFVECRSCFQWLDPSLKRYRADWPEVELDFVDNLSFPPVSSLLSGDLDLVITENPVELDGIFNVPLFAYEAMLAVDKANWLSSREIVLPDDLEKEQLITYPDERDRLDIFTRFLDPLDKEPAGVRTAELTSMIIQLVASGRGVSCLPKWILSDHIAEETVVAKRLGQSGLWRTPYFAIREGQKDMTFMRDFIHTTIKTCFSTLTGIKAVVE